MKHIVIAGAGVIGVVSAYFLLKQGYKVTIIDRHESAANEASGANASCLHNRYIHPKGEPTLFSSIPMILAGQHPMLKFRHLHRPAHLSWAAQLLWQSLPMNADKNQLSLNELASISNKLREESLISNSFNCDLKDSSKLLIYEDADAYAYNKKKFLKYIGVDEALEFYDVDRLIEKEPCLSHRKSSIAGAIAVHSDNYADCQLYTRGLLDRLQSEYDQAFDVRFSGSISSFKTNKNAVNAAILEDGSEVIGDIFILAGGIGTKDMARKLGVSIPLMPAKGYTISVPYIESARRLNRNITYFSKLTVFAPYDDRIRVSSGFFIGEDDYTIHEDRLKVLRDNARYVLPDLNFDNETVYMGHRPCVPNSLPINKVLKGYDNVILNTGHGMFGWSLAHYSGQKMVEITDKMQSNA